MNHLHLHERYIKKNYSIKEPLIILDEAWESYLDEYENKPVMITRSIDFLLHIISKREFLGLIRFTIVLMLSRGISVCKLPDSLCVLSKEDILNELKYKIPELPHYMVIAMYSYL